MKKPVKLKSVSSAKQRSKPLPRQLSVVSERSSKTLSKYLGEFLDGIDDKLFDMADGATNEDRNRLLDAMRELRIKRKGMEKRFRQELLDHFQQLSRVKAAGSQEEVAEKELSLDDLSLVDDDQLEIDVAIGDMARRVRNGCDKQLNAFNHRLQYLFEGRREVDETNGPLEPQLVAQAFQKSMETLDLDIRTSLILFKLFERGVLEATDEVVAAANQQLIDAGVLPEMEAVPVKRRRQPQTGGHTSATSAAASKDTGQSAEQMFGMLQEMLSAMRGLGSAGGATGVAPSGVPQAGAPVDPGNMAVMQNGVAYANGVPVQAGTSVNAVSSDDLLNMLTRLQRVETTLDSEARRHGDKIEESHVKEDLSDLLEAENQGAMHALEQADDDVINLVSMLFDFILDDQDLPTAIKALIGRLQIPLLKVAITDKNFFSNDDHPARELLNVLAKVGAQWSPKNGLDDPLYKLVNDSVIQVLDDYDLDTDLFSDLLDHVSKEMAQQTQRSERVEARVREVEEGRAHAEFANKIVDKELDKRLVGRQLPAVADKLLRGAWRQVLLLTLLREGENSPEWGKQLKVADAVVWSLLPHADEASQTRLKALSPRLIASIDQGLMAANYDSVEKQTLIAALRHAHMLALQGQDSPRQALEPAVVETQPQTSIPLDNPLIKQMRGLVNGQWVELGQGDDALRCKLAANIREGEKLIFINRSGVKALECSAVELAERIYQEDAKLLDSGALFDRALESVIGNMRQVARHQPA